MVDWHAWQARLARRERLLHALAAAPFADLPPCAQAMQIPRTRAREMTLQTRSGDPLRKALWAILQANGGGLGWRQVLNIVRGQRTPGRLVAVEIAKTRTDPVADDEWSEHERDQRGVRTGAVATLRLAGAKTIRGTTRVRP